MAKFAAIGLFAILAAVQYAEGIDMARCAQLAIVHGVPSVKIPPHNPLVVPNNITFHLENFVGSEFTFVLDKITWTNIPWWIVLKNTVTKNTTEVLDVEGSLWWDNFTISFDYLYQWGWQRLEGNVALHYEDITWTADWEETKPDAAGVRKLNRLNIDQKVGKRSIKTTGFGLFGFIADNILLALNDVINEVVINGQNAFGVALGTKVNDVWYGKPAIYNKLVDWCVSQNVTDAYY